jgi:pyrimidine-nucleoside phosphorylase
VDKHSTGGVGDKTTLVVEPMVAGCGLAVGKMSGRGLGFSGGTLDKMESIPGYRINLTREEFLSQLKSLGLVLTGQTGDLAPADGKLMPCAMSGRYSDRDLLRSAMKTPPVPGHRVDESRAGGLPHHPCRARQLARLMVAIGRLSGRQVVALLDMNQPLGNGEMPWKLSKRLMRCMEKDRRRLHRALPTVANQMLVLGKSGAFKAGTYGRIARIWQGLADLPRPGGARGDVNYVDHPERLPSAP